MSTEATPAEPQRRDWSARTRSTAVDAARYSVFVARMQRGLMVAAAAVLAAVLVFALIPRQSSKNITLVFQEMGKIQNDLAMLKPRLTGVDSKGNPFVITAAAAIQDPKNIRRARLVDVEADMSLDQQRWINATAPKGFFDMDAGKLNLAGNISVFSDSGYELHTDSGLVDIKSETFHGPHVVTGQGPLGTFRADRSEVDGHARTVTLIGNVHMTMYLHQSKDRK